MANKPVPGASDYFTQLKKEAQIKKEGVRGLLSVMLVRLYTEEAGGTTARRLHGLRIARGFAVHEVLDAKESRRATRTRFMRYEWAPNGVPELAHSQGLTRGKEVEQVVSNLAEITKAKDFAQWNADDIVAVKGILRCARFQNDELNNWTSGNITR